MTRYTPSVSKPSETTIRHLVTSPTHTSPTHHRLLCVARGLFSLAADGQRQGSGGSASYAHILSILTRLRLLCLHPSLVPAELIEQVRPSDKCVCTCIHP